MAAHGRSPGTGKTEVRKRPAASSAGRQKQRMRRPAAAADKEWKEIAKDENPFDQPPPPGQENLGQFFHIVAPVKKPNNEESGNEAGKEGKSGSPSSSSSSSSDSSSKASEQMARLVFENATDDFDVGATDSEPIDATPVNVSVDRTLENVKDFDSMFRLAERHVARVESFLHCGQIKVLNYVGQTPNFINLLVG